MKKMRSLLLIPAFAVAATVGGGLAIAGSSDARATALADPTGGGIDPRAGGFEIALGEWALTPEAPAIRPGPVTFVIHNRGKFEHGFEIELTRHDDDHSGHHGGGDDAESIKLRPGQSTAMTLDLAPGVYEIECFVSHHDDMGMRGLLEVREDAPLVAPRPAAAPSTVQISGFAFKPATVRTKVGSVVTWRNSDPAPHTATGKQFSSPQLRQGSTYRRRFTRAGTYSYVCALHPGMRGKVVVQPRSAG